MFYQHNMGAGGWVFIALGNIIIWSLVIAFVVWLVRDLRTRPHRDHIISGASASEILDRRLASGEITPGQCQQAAHRARHGPHRLAERDRHHSLNATPLGPPTSLVTGGRPRWPRKPHRRAVRCQHWQPAGQSSVSLTGDIGTRQPQGWCNLSQSRPRPT